MANLITAGANLTIPGNFMIRPSTNLNAAANLTII